MEPILVGDDNPNTIQRPDMYAALSTLVVEIAKIATQQGRDADTLRSIRSDVTAIAANSRLIHGTLKSALSWLPPLARLTNAL